MNKTHALVREREKITRQNSGAAYHHSQMTLGVIKLFGLMLLTAFILSVSLFLPSAYALEAPTLNMHTQGMNVSLAWSPVEEATGYQLLYAPYPYTGAQSIGTIDMGTATSYQVDLWNGASFYVTIQALEGDEVSDYSNIELLTLSSNDRPARNIDFLQTYLAEIENGDRRPIYALYAAGLIAVPRPEVYLQAGRDFLDNIATVPGTAALFERDPSEIMPGEDFSTSGSAFSISQIELTGYEASKYQDLLPADYPYLPGFDQRILPLSALVRSEKVSYLEKASMVYFWLQQEKGYAADDMFIFYGDQEDAWIYANGDLYDHNGQPAAGDAPFTQNIVLVFNEDSCWYPLMGRDDTGKDSLLRTLVSRFSEENLSVKPYDEGVTSLHQVALSTYGQTSEAVALDYLRLIAGHNDSTSQNFYPSVSAFFAEYGHGYLLPLFREEIRTHANMLSPVSDYLSRYLSNKDWSGFQDAFHAYNEWGGETWGCCINVYTVDVGWRLNVGTCHDLSSYAAAASELAGLNWARIHGADYSKGPDNIHFYVYLYEDQLVIDNGYVDDPQGNIYLTRSPYSGEATYSDLDIFLNRDGLALFHLTNDSGNLSMDEAFGTLTQTDFLQAIQELNTLSEDGVSIVALDKNYNEVAPVSFESGFSLLSSGEYFKGQYP